MSSFCEMSSSPQENPFSILSLAKSSPVDRLSHKGGIENGSKTQLTNFELPARGERGEGCGDTIGMFCSSCGHVWEGEQSCMRRACPSCGLKWASARARIAASRCWLLYKQTGKLGRLMHIIASPPQDVDLSTIESYSSARRHAQKLLKRHGVSAGCMIFHPTRRDEAGNEYDSPHFHIAAWIPVSFDVTVDYEDWVIKVIRDARRGDYRGIQKYHELLALMRYELGHAGVSDGVHGLTYFGDWAYNKASQKTLEAEYPEAFQRFRKRCPSCGSEDIETIMGFIGDRPYSEVVDWTGGYPESVLCFMRDGG